MEDNEGLQAYSALRAFPEGVGAAQPDSLPECMRTEEGFHAHFLVEVCANAVYNKRERLRELSSLENYPDTPLTRGGYNYVQDVRGLWDSWTIKPAFNVYTAASAFYLPKEGDWVHDSVTAQGIVLPPKGWSIPDWYADKEPYKSVILAFELPKSYEKFPRLALDTTLPIRAIYFPLLFKGSRYSNLCALTQVDFHWKTQLTLQNTEPGVSGMDIYPDKTRGLGFLPYCLILDWCPLMCSLAIPDDRLLPGEHPCYQFIRLCSPKKAGQQSVNNFTEMDGIGANGAGCRYVWLDEFHSKNDGIVVEFPRPTESESFGLVKSLVATGIGFIPFVGPLLAVAWDVAVMSLKEPEKFRSQTDLTSEEMSWLKLQWKFLDPVLPSLRL
ncbi:hypothetical protein MY10362_008780 [Beauveria mimosiformis]